MHQCWAHTLIAFISLVSLSCGMERIQEVAKTVMSLKMEWCLTNTRAHILGLCSFGTSCAESLGSSCISFEDSTVVSPSWVKMSKKILLRRFDPLRCLKISGTNYPLTWHHIPKEHRSQPNRFKSLKTCTVFYFGHIFCFYGLQYSFKVFHSLSGVTVLLNALLHTS